MKKKETKETTKTKKVKEKNNNEELLLPDDHYYLKVFIFIIVVILLSVGLYFLYKTKYYNNPYYQFNTNVQDVIKTLRHDYRKNYQKEDNIEYLLTITDNRDNNIKNIINKTSFRGNIILDGDQYINNLTTKYKENINNYQIISKYEDHKLTNQVSIIELEYSFDFDKKLNLDLLTLLKKPYHFSENIGAYKLERKDHNYYSLLLTNEEISKLYKDSELNELLGNKDLEIIVETEGKLFNTPIMLTVKNNGKVLKIDLKNDTFVYENNNITLELDKQDVYNWHVKYNNNDKLLIKGDLIISKGNQDDKELIKRYPSDDTKLTEDFRKIVTYLKNSD